MRRWNGWGDTSFSYALPQEAQTYLKQHLGEGQITPDATLEEVIAQVPETRLPSHPLLRCDAQTRMRHARGQSLPDWIALRSGQIDAFPDAVAYPKDAEDVRELYHFAKSAGAHIIPYGGGTSVVGHINAPKDDDAVLTIDMSRLNNLHEFDERSKIATFGAGISGPDLEAQLRARGCTLGHFPQSFEYSTLGGWIATRSSGQQSLGYGRIEKLFAGGSIESPTGTLKIPANIPASAAGPDLREIILGSEGRMGIITAASVRVSPLPEREEFHAVFFPNFEAGREAVCRIMQAKIPLSMLRLSTAQETETTLAMAGHAVLIGGLEKYLALRGATHEKSMLILGATGQASLVKAARKAALQIAAQHQGVYAGQTFGKTWHKNRFKSPYLRNALWEAGYAIDTLESATDWRGIPALVDDIEQKLRNTLESSGEKVHVFTHLSHMYPYGSSIYVQYIFRRAKEASETLRRWQLLKKAASEVIVNHSATISHQHGVGTDHKPYLAAEKGSLGMQTLRGLLTQFDPDGLLNPGKLL